MLTYWTGDTTHQGYRFDEIHLLTQHYREIATVTTPGTHADIHDSTLTADGSALLISFPETQADLSALGGPADGWIRNSVVFQVDIKTGTVQFSWTMADHVPLSDTKQKLDPKSDENGTHDAPLDPYHVNSVMKDGDGALLVSSRNAQAVYRVAGPDRQSAETVATVDADLFEVSAPMPDAAYIAAQALDADGNVLGTATPGSWPRGSAYYRLCLSRTHAADGSRGWRAGLVAAKVGP